MLLSGAGVAATEADTVAGPTGPETSGPADSGGDCWGTGTQAGTGWWRL